MKTIAERIKVSRKQKQLTQLQLANLVNVTATAISQWEREETLPKGGNLLRLSEALSVTPEWLTSGTKSVIMENVNREGAIPCALVPFYPFVKAAGGAGTVINSEDEDYTPVPCNVLKNRNLNSVVCVTVSGDSMEPVLTDGAIIAVDRTEKKIKDGKIYVFRHGDLLRVKVLKQTPTGVIIHSYNSTYPDEIHKNKEIQGLTIVGRVFWVSYTL